jgi:large subunit ribosomal protein L34
LCKNNRKPKSITGLRPLIRINGLAFLLKIVYNYSTMALATTYNPKKKKRARTHGFLVRTKTKGGRNLLKRRRQKGRVKLTTI